MDKWFSSIDVYARFGPAYFPISNSPFPPIASSDRYPIAPPSLPSLTLAFSHSNLCFPPPFPNPSFQKVSPLGREKMSTPQPHRYIILVSQDGRVFPKETPRGGIDVSWGVNFGNGELGGGGFLVHRRASPLNCGSCTTIRWVGGWAGNE